MEVNLRDWSTKQKRSSTIRMAEQEFWFVQKEIKTSFANIICDILTPLILKRVSILEAA